jgi:hypothetical protein
MAIKNFQAYTPYRGFHDFEFFIVIFEFVGQFFFQSDVFKFQEVFSGLEISVFFENELGSFETFLILKILRILWFS